MRENSSKKSETILSGVSSQSLAEGTPILATWQPGDTDAAATARVAVRQELKELNWGVS